MSHVKALIKPQIVKTLRPEDTIASAAEIMSSKHIGSVIMTDKKGKIVGIFTERDLLNKVIAKGLDPKKTPMSQVMTPNVATVTPDATIAECFTMMKTVGCRHLPVVENNQVIAVVSIRHVLSWTIDELKYERDQLNKYIHS